METGYVKDANGRIYKILIDRSGAEDMSIILGPHEGLVDDLGLSAEQATKLHNILYERDILSYKSASVKNIAIGVALEIIQDKAQALTLAQKLVEAFRRFET